MSLVRVFSWIVPFVQEDKDDPGSHTKEHEPIGISRDFVLNHKTMAVDDHFFHPRNVGDASEPSFVGRAASLLCGAAVRVSIQIDEQHRIAQAKFKAAGCSALVASLSKLTERVTGLAPADAAVIAQSPTSILGDSGDINCTKLGSDALVSAIQKYSDAVRHEWNGDEALICTCFCVSERVIETEIAQKSLSTVSEVIQACNAGGGCGSCHPLIQDIIDSIE